MRRTSRLACSQLFLMIVFALVGFSLCTTRAAAQTGKNAVYDSTGACCPCAKSPAFIDATVFISKPSSDDICSVLNWVLTPSNGIVFSHGAVIDARGLPFTTPPTSMTCTTFVRSKLPNESI